MNKYHSQLFGPNRFPSYFKEDVFQGHSKVTSLLSETLRFIQLKNSGAAEPL